MDHNEGVYNKDNPSLYRDALFYGTFQGVRIDYALQPKSADSNLEFRIAPGSYVASALLLSDYWMKSAPNKELYQDIDSTWKLESRQTESHGPSFPTWIITGNTAIKREI